MRKTIILIILGLLITSGCSRKFRLPIEDINKANDWPFYHGQLDGQGVVENSDFSGNLDIIWEHKLNDKPAGPLTIYQNRLIYPGTRNRIRFFDKITGHYEGRIKPRGTPRTGVVIQDSLACFAVSPKKSKLRCVNLLNGKTVWKKRVKDVPRGSIIVNDMLIIGLTDGQLNAYRLDTGEEVWKFDTGGRINTPSVFDQGRLFQPVDDGRIIALDIADGSKLFEVQLDKALVSSITIDSYLFAVDIEGNVYKIDVENGNRIWKKEYHLTVWSAPCISKGRLYFGSSNGIVTALDATDGNVIWQFDVVDVIKSSVLINNDYLLFGTMTGDFYSLNISDGSVVAKRKLNGAISTSPVSDGRRVYVATDNGIITCFGDNHESIQSSN